MTEQKPTTTMQNQYSTRTGSTSPPQSTRSDPPADSRRVPDNPSPMSKQLVEVEEEEESGRERLKRHRIEVAGRVWIPDIWGQEELLKDWIDCNAFDATLVNNSIMSARAALVQQVRTTNSGLALRVENT